MNAAPELFDRKIFFDTLRPSFKSFTVEQVSGIETKLRVWEAYHAGEDMRFLADCLAQGRWETGGRMVPVREAWNASPAARVKYLTNLYDVKGSNPTRAVANGNTLPGDGVKYCGNGDIQITWKNNYAKFSKILGVDLVANPELVLDPVISARIMFYGMLHGSFTGKKLSDFITNGRLNVFNSRAVVNGDKDKIPKGETRTIGVIIEDYYVYLLDALRLAQKPEPVIAPEPTIAVLTPDEQKGTDVTTFGPSLAAIVAQAVAQGITAVANNPSIPELRPDAASPVSQAVQSVVQANPLIREVTATVEKAVTPVPWYKSAVTVGSIIGVVAAVANIFGVNIGLEQQAGITTAVVAGAGLIGPALALASRLRSKLNPVTLTKKA